MSFAEVEIVLRRRVVPQPSPAIVRGGDCGACCLAGVLGLSVREVYELNQEGPAALSWWCMQQVIDAATSQGLLADAVTTVPIWPDVHPAHMAWGLPSITQSTGWIDYVRLGLAGGYYAIAQVNYARRGAPSEPDHWVTICGMRRRWMPPDGEIRSLHTEVLVSCSAAGGSEEWVSARDFLTKRGGFAPMLVKPRKESR